MAPPQRPGAKGSPGSSGDARALGEADRRERHQTEELAEACARTEEELEGLKARFEMYFLGVERREPARERGEMRRRVLQLKAELTRNTGLRFRIDTLHARFLSYERMWTRSSREKEDGTYRRDLVRARRHAHAPAKSAAPEAAGGTTPATAEKPAPPPLPAPSTAMPRGPGEKRLRALFDEYVQARRSCNEDVSRVSYEALSRAVLKQVPELMAKYKATSVDFKVVIQGGKAVLKAVPRA